MYTIQYRTAQWAGAILSMRGHFLPFLCEYYKDCGWRPTADLIYTTSWRRVRSHHRITFGRLMDDMSISIVYDPRTGPGKYGLTIGGVS
jgi:hypothetical protein